MMAWWAEALAARPASLKTHHWDHAGKRANAHRLSSGFHAWTLLRTPTPPMCTSTHKSEERRES